VLSSISDVDDRTLEGRIQQPGRIDTEGAGTALQFRDVEVFCAYHERMEQISLGIE
jgi:hypothetical protein